MREFGLIGYPLGHSFSKKYFGEKFEAENIDARYELYPLEVIDKFPELIQKVELTGLNVTIPYKEKVMKYLDELDETAAKIGAVNVIKFIREGDKTRLKGYNSDAIGFENSIKKSLGILHKKALILGTGGASKAIKYTLEKLGLEVTYVSRTRTESILSYKDLTKDIIEENLLIANSTPLGMYPDVDACPDIPYEHISSEHILFDAIYKPDLTLFLQKGEEKGAKTINGLEMLYGQAEAAWKIWNS